MPSLTAREQVLLAHDLDITPIAEPLFPWPEVSQRKPTDYLPYHPEPFGHAVAQWQAGFFGVEVNELAFRSAPEIAPRSPDAPSLIVLFYPDNEINPRRSLDIYLTRLSRLARMGEQTILYIPPELAPTVRAMRPGDPHWYIIAEFPTIWDIPNNTYQRHNFTHTQPKLFARFRGSSKVFDWWPDEGRDHPHRSAVYNAKAFATYDAVMRNPFGSETWMYIDAGMYDEFGPVTAEPGREPEIWGAAIHSSLSPSKFARSVAVSGDSGVVIGEYMESPAYGGTKTINHPSWTDPTLSWLCHNFIAHAYVGSSLGMLNYSVRFMQTVDDMDANSLHSSREEFVMPWVAIRYPNTIFSIPWLPLFGDLWCQGQYPMKLCYSDVGGAQSVPPIVDPISTIFCADTGYKPRKPNLPGSGLYARTWKTVAYIWFRQ